jgi:hypothetical protein
MEEEILYCSQSIKAGTKTQKRKLCVYEECKTRPSYNFEGNKKPLYCSTHKLKEMIDVISTKCIYKNCFIQPIYNYEGEIKASFCSQHKQEGMIDIKNKTCIFEGCKTIPIYNYNGETKRLYCALHKLNDMVNVKHKPCIYEACNTRPTYNVEGNSKPLYCSNHKLEKMINVVSITCNYVGCKTYPLYNFEGENIALNCASHRLDGMIDIKNKRCIYEGCKTIPAYNFDGKIKRLYCATHKLDKMINVKNKTCKSEWCYTIVKEKYDGYCLFCYVNLFPDKPTARNYKTKEYSVVEFVKTLFPNFDWIGDKKIVDGCSKRRPDLLLDLGYQIIIVEIDENQHIDYDCSCENKRIMELSQDLGHRPIIFIRFNPDNYNANGTNVTSCWGQNKNGLCVIKKSKKNEWTERLNTLGEQISYWVNPENKTSKTVEIIQLFYDV